MASSRFHRESVTATQKRLAFWRTRWRPGAQAGVQRRGGVEVRLFPNPERAPPLDLATGRIVANLFLEDSMPTRVNFTVAARRLGADTVDLTGPGSGLSKSETLLDTALTVEAMGVAALVVASPCEGTPARIAAAVSCAVINAGDGRHEHPTQGLGDILTVRQRWGDLSQVANGVAVRMAVLKRSLNPES